METLERGRDYSMSDAELAMLAAALAVYVERDMQELSGRDVSPADLSELILRRKAFREFPSDDDSQGKILEANQHKDAMHSELSALIERAVAHALRHWGENSPALRRMNIAALNELNDSDFTAAAARVYHTVSEYPLSSVEHGYSPDFKDALHLAIEKFDAAIAERDKAMSDRIGCTRTRIALGNDLYALCSYLSGVGKKVYQNTNYAKYPDYLLYKDTTPATPPEAVSQLHYADGKLQWDALESATSYQLMLRLNIEQDFNEVYAGSNTQFAFPLPDPPVQGISSYHFKVRARNAAGVGEFSEECVVNAE